MLGFGNVIKPVFDERKEVLTMPDYEAMILEKQDDTYDGISEQDDTIEVRQLNFATGNYDTVKTLNGDAARAYMEANGIW